MPLASTNRPFPFDAKTTKSDSIGAQLRWHTPSVWFNTVSKDFDRFLCDHAAAEKKAAGMAISMASHYPDKTALVKAMAELAVEEMSHYREVVKLIHQRGGITRGDEKDEYVNRFRQHIRRGSEAYFLDRLLLGGIIEARGAERFGLIATGLENTAEDQLAERGLNDPKLAVFYRAITRSEERHLEEFIALAQRYFQRREVNTRLDQLLDAEAEIISSLPFRPALH